MTVKERLQELREQIANTPGKNDKKGLFIELLAYNNFAVANGDDRDITSIKDLDSYWKKAITKHGVFDKMYDDLTDEQIINHANDPKGFKSALEKAQEKFVKDSLKAEEDKFFKTHEKISDKEFERRTAKNGWALKRDSVIAAHLYKIAKQTNDEKLVAVYEKFLSTDARDPAVRKQMLTEMNEAFSTFDKTKYLVSLNSIAMGVLKKKLKEDPTREEIDKACKKYEADEKENKERSIKEAKKAAEEKALKEREAKEQAELGKILAKNGWPEADLAADKFYRILVKPVHRNLTETTDGVNEFLEKLKSTKLEKGAEQKQMNELIDKGIALAEKNKTRKNDEYFKAKRYICDVFRNYDKEKEQFIKRLKENGWLDQRFHKEASTLYDATHIADGYVTDKKPLMAFYDKLWDTKIDEKFPKAHKFALIKELTKTYKAVRWNKNAKDFPKEIIDVKRLITSKDVEKEKENYYGLGKLKDKEKIGGKFKEYEIRGDLPTFDDLVDEDKIAQRRQKEEQKRLRQEQKRIEQEEQLEQQRLQLEQQEAQKVSTAIMNKLRNYITDINTAPAFYQRGHQDSDEMSILKEKATAVITTVNNAQDTHDDLMKSELFKWQLFEAYKAADAYKRAKRIEAKKDPYDKSYIPGSNMGQARWRAADTIIDLALTYIGDTIAKYETLNEKMNTTNETKPENTVVQQKINKEYDKIKQDILKINARDSRKSLINDNEKEKASDNKTLVNKTAAVLALHMVNSLYQTNAQAGVIDDNDKEEFSNNVLFAKGEMQIRDDFMRMMETNTPDEIITAATTNGGKPLIDKLAAAKKALAAEAQLANANKANKNGLENANEINNNSNIIKDAAKNS